jgi:hypothetical protein
MIVAGGYGDGRRQRLKGERFVAGNDIFELETGRDLPGSGRSRMTRCASFSYYNFHRII